MPLVIVNRDATLVSDSVINDVAEMIRYTVASHLNVFERHEAHLSTDDIQLIVRDVRKGLDVGCVPFSVTVFANDYPERRANLEERSKKIAEQISRTLKHASGDNILYASQQRCFVWILLTPAGFAVL